MKRQLTALLTALLLSSAPTFGQESPTEKPAELTESDIAEAKKFAEQFSEAVYDEDKKALAKMVDWGACFGQMLDALKVDKEEQKLMLTALQSQKSMFLDSLILPVRDCDLHVLRVRQRDGCVAVVIRTDGIDGLAYYDLMLKKNTESGKLKLVDIHDYSQCGGIVETGSRFALTMGLGTGSASLFEDVDVREAMGTFIESVRQLMQSGDGDYEEIFAKFDALPEELKQNEYFLAFEFALLSELRDDPTYADRFEAIVLRMKSAYGDGSPAEYMLLGRYFEEKKFSKAREVIATMDKAVGGDPLLRALEGEAFASEGNLDEAERLSKLAEKAEPDSLWVLDLQFKIAVKRGKTAGAVKLATKMRDDHYYLPDPIDYEDEDMKPFFQTPEYEKLLEEEMEETKPES